MRILAFTTSTPRFDAVLYDSDADAIVAQTRYDDEMGHAERSLVAIDAMFVEAGLSPSDIDAVAVDLGPGSFTGVRVGVAGAKGIALARDIPLIGVSSLAAIAAAGEPARVDAKRGEMFVADGDGILIVKKDAPTAQPRAIWIAKIASARGATQTVDEIEPIYARAPDAKKPTQPPKLSRA